MTHFSVNILLTKAGFLTKKGETFKAVEIYKKILNKFPKNIEAKKGLENLKNKNISESNPPKDVVNYLENIYNQNNLDLVLEKTKNLLIEYPRSFILWNLLGVLKLNNKNMDEAFYSFKKAVSLNTSFEDGYVNLGNIYKNKANFSKALYMYKKALDINPKNTNALFSLGNILMYQKELENAKKFFKICISFDPNYFQAYNGLGQVLIKQGEFQDAVFVFKKAVIINPKFYLAYNNLGMVLQEQGKLFEAIKAYENAVILKPDYSEAYGNLGSALQLEGKLNLAIQNHNKSISTNPSNSLAYNNLGTALHEKGLITEAIEAYKNSIFINPKNDQAWNNIFYSLQSLKKIIPCIDQVIFELFKEINSASSKIRIELLKYKLKVAEGVKQKQYKKIISFIKKTENIKIKNPSFIKNNQNIQYKLPEAMISLVHFGRSGTSLLHSLVDQHKQISTLPGIYLSEYFDHNNWEKIISNGWNKMVDNFISSYEVLFDATSKSPVITKGKKYLNNVGFSEGFTNVGKDKNEKLKINKTLFSNELTNLMNYYEDLDSSTFFKLVHIAFDRTNTNFEKKDTIFYHIHNPDVYSKLNFANSNSCNNWIMMVREPVQSCESWLKDCYDDGDYSNCSIRIITMLLDIDNIIYQKQKSIGVRLEDLKKYPKQTLKALCNWMNIKETRSLYNMTMQGKKWWGDPTSPDYLIEGMDPFGQLAIKRKIGSIFSEKDQFILNTFFYPFNVRFNYVDEDFNQFIIDLKTVRPMLNEIFDFEKELLRKKNICSEDFKKSGSYLFFRSILIERWNILNKHYTYPNLIKPLIID